MWKTRSGAPFLAVFARSGAFDFRADLRGLFLILLDFDTGFRVVDSQHGKSPFLANGARNGAPCLYHPVVSTM